ncbi:Cholesterol desaturase daf-36 [Folsomia candida]|uniref:cholesterol 7-desaturase n=1 Tax=Folsomia candida TaxID=158441 RepID=A0A226EFE8_FOLCA|nr:Cholesterol desaturase daf-36 [Folsomia candida]
MEVKMGIEILGICLVLIIYLCWRVFFRPFNLFRDFGDLGFESVSKTGNDIYKRNAINEMRKRRKNGKLPPSYPNGWFAILESESLKAGETKEIYALGQNLVAWRGRRSGVTYVADAYCPHLGAHLGVGGEVKGDCIQCPFHGWEFDGEKEGKLTRIPYAEKVPGFAQIKLWPVTETNGFIFVWFHSEGSGPSWNLDPIPEIVEGKWSYRGRSEMRVACHIQISRDIRIWNRKCFLDKPILIREEQTIKLFRRWFSQFYYENSNSDNGRTNYFKKG